MRKLGLQLDMGWEFQVAFVVERKRASGRAKDLFVDDDSLGFVRFFLAFLLLGRYTFD